jgi:hypothetical protein
VTRKLERDELGVRRTASLTDRFKTALAPYLTDNDERLDDLAPETRP